MININLKKKILLASKHKKAAWHVLTDGIFYKNKPTPYPRLINLFVTERCNFACPMCHVKESRQNYQRAGEGDTNFETIKKLIEESAPFQPSYQMIGGEPLLSADIFRILALLKKHKLPSGLTTNGLLLEKYAKEIIESGLDFLAISLDGPDEETQFQRGNVKGSFEKIIEGIKMILELRNGNAFPNMRIATVISRFNLKNFEKILDLSKRIGADQWSLSHYFYYYDKIKKDQENFGSKYNMGSSVWGDYIGDKKEFFTDEEIKLIREKYENILKQTDNSKTEDIKISVQKDIDIEKYYKGFVPQKGSICTSPYYQVFIRGNGDVELCQGYILGNIKQSSLKELWNNEKAVHFRKVFSEKGIMPSCFRCCAMSKFKF